jgi:hypothetical protein
MSTGKNIHNLDSLEREIYRLRLEAKNMEQQLDKNLSYLQKHYSSMTLHSIFQQKEPKELLKEKILHSVWENEKLQQALGKIVDHLVDKTVEGAETVFDKVFHKKS